MKKLITSLTLFLSFGFLGYAQETTNPETSNLKMYKREKPVEKNTENPKLTKEEEIANCKNLLTALDEKEAWLKSNPEELAKATEAGWFEEATITRATLTARIKELETN